MPQQLVLSGAAGFNQISGASTAPTGVVHPFAGSAAPTGWFLCDGSTVSRVTYALLFSLIGETHGSGDGTTTFNLPDYRGYFLRGVDNGAGRDPDSNVTYRLAMNPGGNTGDAVGSVQADAVVDHTHTYNEINANPGPSVGDGQLTYPSGSSSPQTGGPSTFSTSETRAKNAYVNYIIKY